MTDPRSAAELEALNTSPPPLEDRCQECLCPLCQPDALCPSCHGKGIGNWVREQIGLDYMRPLPEAVAARFRVQE